MILLYFLIFQFQSEQYKMQRISNERKDTSDLFPHTSLSFSGGLPRPYLRVHPPLLFGTVGILVYTRGILGDVVILWRCARRCRFIRKASRKPACTRILPPTLIWSASDLFKDPPWQSALHPSNEIPTSLWSRISLC